MWTELVLLWLCLVLVLNIPYLIYVDWNILSEEHVFNFWTPQESSCLAKCALWQWTRQVAPQISPSLPPMMMLRGALGRRRGKMLPMRGRRSRGTPPEKDAPKSSSTSRQVSSTISLEKVSRGFGHEKLKWYFRSWKRYCPQQRCCSTLPRGRSTKPRSSGTISVLCIWLLLVRVA